VSNFNILYGEDNVLEAAQKRTAWIFDYFATIYISISGGKDSTVIWWLFTQEAMRRGRTINAFFLDQEAEYDGTIKQMRHMMSHPAVIPHWYQVPINMTDSTSYDAEFLMAWGKGEEWLRPKEPNAITHIDGDYPKRFYAFFPWLEAQATEPTAWVIGLRSKESLNRFRAVTKQEGYPGILWSTKTDNPLAYRFYPIYDWCFGDVFKLIADEDIQYNDVYDKLFRLQGINVRNMRVSNLIHEKSFDCLTELQEIEPENYERVLRRIKGAHCAARYANETTMYKATERPAHFETWLEYRDYLLSTAPVSRRERFESRFAGQDDAEYIYQQQCHQILINDWENNIPVKRKSQDWRKKWSAIL